MARLTVVVARHERTRDSKIEGKTTSPNLKTLPAHVHPCERPRTRTKLAAAARSLNTRPQTAHDSSERPNKYTRAHTPKTREPCEQSKVTVSGNDRPSCIEIRDGAGLVCWEGSSCEHVPAPRAHDSEPRGCWKELHPPPAACSRPAGPEGVGTANGQWPT